MLTASGPWKIAVKIIYDAGREGQAHEHDNDHAAEDEEGYPFDAHLNSPVRAKCHGWSDDPWKEEPPKGIRN
jgi:hypothetical protein